MNTIYHVMYAVCTLRYINDVSFQQNNNSTKCIYAKIILIAKLYATVTHVYNTCCFSFLCCWSSSSFYSILWFRCSVSIWRCLNATHIYKIHVWQGNDSQHVNLDRIACQTVCDICIKSKNTNDSYRSVDWVQLVCNVFAVYGCERAYKRKQKYLDCLFDVAPKRHKKMKRRKKNWYTLYCYCR